MACAEGPAFIHTGGADEESVGDYLKFRIQFRERQASDLEAGSVDLENPFPDPSTADPDALKRYIYNVSITNERVRLSEGGGVLLTNSFPDPRDSCFSYRFSDPTSAMAATLYHELLHIWWMNKNQTNRLLSGHGPDLRSCANYEPGFVQRLRGFYRAMDALDSCLAKPAPKPTTTGKPQPTARPSP